MLSSRELRELFLSYFAEKGHKRVPSHSLIPPADPTLLFVNAGMVQFKDIFVGNRSVEYNRATSSQKCLRVSGKHNDLENVGRTARHHTFFEMLGNFSFGDYFKREAIEFAYEFLVQRVGLDPSRMFFTIFGGDEADNLDPDLEAEGYWAEVAGIPREQVLRFGKKDNFWAMGDTGPCGPCSEILYDRGPGPWACGEPDCRPGCDCDRYVEIWNLVFMQFVRKEAGGTLAPLPAPSIDTGMGLERLAAIVQQQPSNYETDLFLAIIEFTRDLLQQKVGRDTPYRRGEGGEQDVAYRVIADHARAAAFLVADGVYPDNEGRGYITRLLVRRAVRFGRKLGFAEPFLCDACGKVVEEMGAAYPELVSRRAVIDKVVRREEETFMQTFDEGARALEQELDRLAAANKTIVGGEFLFWLHDERGLQPDLAELIASERSFAIDRAGYDRLMAAKRSASGKEQEGTSSGREELLQELARESGPTRFLGYEEERVNARTLALLDGDQRRQKLARGERGELVVDQTPCYAESGGQVGDTGTVQWPGGQARIHGTTKTPGDLFLHHVEVLAGELVPGSDVEIAYESGRKAGVRAHHSATHLLHWALNEVLGDHVKQEGSLVRDDLLRFDFRHFSPISSEEAADIEVRIARLVLENSPVETRTMPLQDAVKSGAKAFFDEKYAEDVRVVSMGHGQSQELCGGTHVERTGDIGFLRITRQEAVSSGVRRIYAVCHEAYVRTVATQDARLQRVTELLKTVPEDLEARIGKLLDRVSTLEKENRELEEKLLSGAARGGQAGHTVTEIAGVAFAFALLGEGEDKKVRTMADMLRDTIKSGVVMVGAPNKGRVTFVVARTKDAAEPFHCGNAVREAAQIMGARGGGKPEFGQAGGGDAQQWEAAVERVKELIATAAQGN